MSNLDNSLTDTLGAESAVVMRARWRDYLEMCKPRVVLLMLLCALVGMFLATPGMVPWDVIVFGLTGIGLVAGSAAVVNHLADAQIDARMARTQNRPVATDGLTRAVGLCSLPSPVVWACSFYGLG